MGDIVLKETGPDGKLKDVAVDEVTKLLVQALRDASRKTKKGVQDVKGRGTTTSKQTARWRSAAARWREVGRHEQQEVGGLGPATPADADPATVGSASAGVVAGPPMDPTYADPVPAALKPATEADFAPRNSLSTGQQALRTQVRGSREYDGTGVGGDRGVDGVRGGDGVGVVVGVRGQIDAEMVSGDGVGVVVGVRRGDGVDAEMVSGSSSASVGGVIDAEMVSSSASEAGQIAGNVVDNVIGEELGVPGTRSSMALNSNSSSSAASEAGQVAADLVDNVIDAEKLDGYYYGSSASSSASSFFTGSVSSSRGSRGRPPSEPHPPTFFYGDQESGSEDVSRLPDSGSLPDADMVSHLLQQPGCFVTAKAAHAAMVPARKLLHSGGRDGGGKSVIQCEVVLVKAWQGATQDSTCPLTLPTLPFQAIPVAIVTYELDEVVTEDGESDAPRFADLVGQRRFAREEIAAWQRVRDGGDSMVGRGCGTAGTR